MTAEKYDLVISGGNVISFQDSDILEGFNVGVTDGEIKAITKKPLHGNQEIDAHGKYISPGFIDFHSHVNGRYFSAERMLRQGVATTIGGERYFDASIIRKIETDGFLINHGFLISNSFSLRRAVGIQDPTQRATKAEIENMIDLEERFFDFGSLGVHVGLEYVPGTSNEELGEILRAAYRYGRVAMIHLRNDGYRSLESLDEIIDLTEKTGAAVNLLHTMYMAGYDGVMDQYLEKIEKARQRGCDITADTGVYAAYPTLAGSMNLGEGWKERHHDNKTESNILVSSGIHVGEFCSPQLFRHIRQNFPTTLMTAFFYDEKQIVKALRPSWMMVSTNGAYGPHGENIGHPEGSGTFPRLLSKYVRDEKVISLQEAIGKITWLPACRFGLEKKKGDIRVGMDADLTIFDLEKIKDNADYVCNSDPNAAPDGIDVVIIAGHIVLQDGIINPERKNCGSLITAS